MASTKLTSQDKKDLDKFTKYLVYKCIQVIVQSRLGEKAKTLSKAYSSGSDWFNLALKDLPEVFSEAKKVFSGTSLAIGQSVCVEMSLRTAEGESMVLETWNITMMDQYDTNARVSYTVYNRMGILLKSLICVSRVAPAYRLSRKQGAETFVICYRIYNGEPQTQHLGAGFECHKVGSVPTPLGTVVVSLNYRTKMLISPQVSRDFGGDFKDDHFCTDVAPRRTQSKPCQVAYRESRNQTEDRLSVGSGDSSDYCATTFSTSPLDPSPTNLQVAFAGHSPPAKFINKRQSTDEEKLNEPTENGNTSLLRTPRVGAFAPSKESEATDTDGSLEDIPFVALLQQPEEKTSGSSRATSSSGASGGVTSDGDSATTDPDPNATQSNISSIKNHPTTSPIKYSDSPSATPQPGSAPEDYVMVELKTPFAGTDGNTELGQFFRACQGAPTLDMFTEDETVEETLNSISEQLVTFEENVNQFDDFLATLKLEEDEEA